MLIGIFKSNQKIVNVLLVLLSLILWLPSFFIDIDSSNLISTQIKSLDIIISLSLIIGQSIYLNFIVDEYKLIQQNSHLTSLVFVVLNSFCLWMLDLNQIVIANLFILLAFHQILKLYDVKNTLSFLFNAGFLIAIATFFYLPSILFFALIWFGLVHMTSPKARDFIVSIIGFSVPMVYFFSYKFVTESLTDIQMGEYLFTIFNIEWADLSFFTKLNLSILIVLILVSFKSLTAILNKGTLRTRKMLFTVLFMSIIGLFGLLLNKADYLATFIMITIPLSIVVASFFQNLKKKWLGELLFSFLILGIVLNYFS